MYVGIDTQLVESSTMNGQEGAQVGALCIGATTADRQINTISLQWNKNKTDGKERETGEQKEYVH